MMKQRHWILCGILLLLGGCLYEFLTGLRTNLYHGRVVDEETGFPLAGTVVTVIWSRSSYLGYEAGPDEFLNAQEAVTDSNGNFTLLASSGLNWEPYTARSGEPWIVMYQPGYEPLMQDNFERHGFETTDALVVALKSGATVKLRKLGKNEIGKYVNLEVVHPLSTPLEHIPNLIGVINAQRKVAGFRPYVIETPQKGKLP